jgi:hypothetical protein
MVPAGILRDTLRFSSLRSRDTRRRVSSSSSSNSSVLTQLLDSSEYPVLDVPRRQGTPRLDPTSGLDKKCSLRRPGHLKGLFRLRVLGSEFVAHKA